MTVPSPEVLTPDAADKKTRKADPSPVADPEAPFGWMNDPSAPGGKRPRKRPGRQKSGPKVQAPPSRPATKARVKAAPPAAKQDYSGPVSELAQGVWMVMAAIPSVDQKIGRINLADVSTRFKAQASILKENGDGVVKGLNMMALHNPQVRAGIEKLSAESGPAWILPAMMLMMPFVGQSVAMWRAPVSGDVELLAKRTEKEFDDLMNSSMRAAAAEQENADLLAAQDAARATQAAGA
jgi:hypothetical protein